jgi:alkylhydroperoxidase/carboxymuconolactone decarboxylase family protein YurZ
VHYTDEKHEALSHRQKAILPVAAFAAVGDIDGLSKALEHGLDAGLTVSEIKEILIQLYAYAGFPRSLNALSELMKVSETRRTRGVQDAQGEPPGRPIPKSDALLAAGTANQTKLLGAPVTGALFDFAPAVDEYLKNHLFGDIFERDNLDWQSREIATVGMLSSLMGVELQLQSHIRISMNVGITVTQLLQAAQVLAAQVNAEAGRRAHEAIAQITGARNGG